MNMRKLLGKAPPEPSQSARAGATGSAMEAAPSRRWERQELVYVSGAPIGSMAQSPDGRFAILASNLIFKTIRVDDGTVSEGIDLRALIKAQAPPRIAGAGSVADQLSIRDVKWGGPSGCNIYTACASGKIFTYDISRAGSRAAGGTGLDFVQTREDTRQVNALDINPHRPTTLLSGSQDGFVRCFDIREPYATRAGLSFRTMQTFKCNADGVRHVGWSPKQGVELACGTEQGVVLKWDMRNARVPLLRINAHVNETCAAMAWHPDGTHVMSGGRDGKCHVWDLSNTADKRQRPKFTVSAPAPVAALAWRPATWSRTAQARRSAQVAVSYGASSPANYAMAVVHVWDLARPAMPYKELQCFDSSPSTLLWRSKDLLWTARQDGVFAQCNVRRAAMLVDRQPVSSFCFSARGDLALLLDQRRPPRQLKAEAYESEEEAVRSFLAPERDAGRRRTNSPSARTTSGAERPAAPVSDGPLLPLVEAVQVTGLFRPEQTMAIGHAPGAADGEVYGYLSRNYLEKLYATIPHTGRGSLVDRVAEVLAHFARAAERLGRFRLAQSWRIVALVTDTLLRRRAQYHLELRQDRIRTHADGRPIPAECLQRSAHLLGTPADVATIFKNAATGADRSPTTTTSLGDEHTISHTAPGSFEAPTGSFACVAGSQCQQPADVEDGAPHVVDTDFLDWPDDAPYPYPLQSDAHPLPVCPALQPYELIAQFLQFEARTSALNASAIVLLLKPLVPADIIDPLQASAILGQHHARLTSTRHMVEAALLRKMSVKGWPGPPLSNWGENYPALFAPTQTGVTVGLACATCRKPREMDRRAGCSDSVWRCQRCRAVAAPCAVCGHREQAAASVSTRRGHQHGHFLGTWWYCPGCAHGGHAACMQLWHGGLMSPKLAEADDLSEGCCPRDGCGHACLPGRWRAETSVARSGGVGRAATSNAASAAVVGMLPLSATTAASDLVQPSRAVESAREALGVVAGPDILVGGGAIRPINPKAWFGIGRDRRKSVKFAMAADPEG